MAVCSLPQSHKNILGSFERVCGASGGLRAPFVCVKRCSLFINAAKVASIVRMNENVCEGGGVTTLRQRCRFQMSERSFVHLWSWQKDRE